jgi:DNA-directed RNA polymerase subunit RPC12/RpoP
VFSEIDILYKKYQPSYFYIVDESFGTNKDRVKEFCARIKPYNIKWRASYRVTDMTKEIAALLKDGNCDSVAFGMESADNRILKSMKKGITVEQIESAIELCVEAGLNVTGNFIFGDIAETVETAKNTLAWWKKYEKFGFGLNFITTYPGTYLFKYAVENKIVDDEIKFIKDGCPMINVSKMNIDEMKWLAEQVNTLPLRNLTVAKNITNIKIDYSCGTVSFEYTCSNCGHENYIDNIRLFVPRNSAACEKCGKRHSIPLFEELKLNIESAINKLIKEYNGIAFWAMTDTLSFYLEQISNIADNSVFLIDGSILKQGSSLAGKIIMAPDVLDIENIETVIIPPTLYFPIISERINSSYKTVKKVIPLIELCDPDFMKEYYV